MTINIEDSDVMRRLKAILGDVKGVTVVSAVDISSSSNGLEEALDDVKNGRVTEYKSKEEFFQKFEI
ncbi:MAG: hypothetical protein Q4D41_01945 [Prevotellaceae bacterium]|nr:hypothetical protein [Prevotellaceae bacterium]